MIENEEIKIGWFEGMKRELREMVETKRYFVGDNRIWMVVMLLMAISLLEVFSASSRFSFAKSNYMAPILSHIVSLAVGFIAMFVTHRIHYKYYRALVYPLLGGSLLCLLLLSIRSMGQADAQRWITIFGFNFQPSEMAKLALILFTAHEMSKTDLSSDEAQRRCFRRVIIVTFATALLIFTENLSTAILLTATIMLTMLIGGVSRKRVVVLTLIGILTACLALMALVVTPNEKLANSKIVPSRALTWKPRVTDFFDKKQEPRVYALTTAREKTQETHAKIAIANSGLVWGRGIGNSVERDYIQEATCDFIYAIIIEECGMLGAIVVLILYLLLMYLSGTVISKCKERFPSYLVVGVTLMITLQAFMNMAVAVDAMPVTGQPLPLISRGGSSILFCSVYIGIILSVSYRTTKENSVSADTISI